MDYIQCEFATGTPEQFLGIESGNNFPLTAD
jgi:hypothetical protein